MVSFSDSQKRTKNDPAFRLLKNLRARVKDAIRQGIRSTHTKELVGCPIDELMDHLASQFSKDMSWDNYGKWTVDHIRPCSTFDLEDQPQQFVCFNWRNLQPLSFYENSLKSGNYTPLDEVAWVERMISLGHEGELFLKYEEGNSS